MIFLAVKEGCKTAPSSNKLTFYGLGFSLMPSRLYEMPKVIFLDIKERSAISRTVPAFFSISPYPKLAVAYVVKVSLIDEEMVINPENRLVPSSWFS